MKDWDGKKVRDWLLFAGGLAGTAFETIFARSRQAVSAGAVRGHDGACPCSSDETRETMGSNRSSRRRWNDEPKTADFHPHEGADDMRRYRWTIAYIAIIVTLMFIIELLQLWQEGTLWR